VTNQDVTVTVTGSQQFDVLNTSGGADFFVFTDNGQFVFEVQDKARNIFYLTASVTRIDKQPPTALVIYSTT
jgi:hypothetical protein